MQVLLKHAFIWMIQCREREEERRESWQLGHYPSVHTNWDKLNTGFRNSILIFQPGDRDSVLVSPPSASQHTAGKVQKLEFWYECRYCKWHFNLLCHNTSYRHEYSNSLTLLISLKKILLLPWTISKVNIPIKILCD